jgi:hypothetical protein
VVGWPVEGCWLTTNRRPAAVIVPVRAAVPVDAATSNSTAAVPFPLAPARTAIQGESEEAVQVHSALDGRTSKAPEPPVWLNVLDGSDREKPQSAAACITSTRCSFRTTEPRRTCGSGLAAAATSTDPSPCPDAPVLMASQVASTEAVQAHSRAAETLKLLVAPAAGTCPSPLTVTAHRLIEDGDVAVAVVADEPQPLTPTTPITVRAMPRTIDGRVIMRFWRTGSFQCCSCAPKVLPYRRGKEAVARLPNQAKSVGRRFRWPALGAGIRSAGGNRLPL